MLTLMALLFESLWRSVFDCLRPRVLALSLLPLGLMAALAYALGMVYWGEWVTDIGEWLEARTWLSGLLGWLHTASFGLVDPANLRNALAPLLVLAVTVPLVVVVSLLVVSFVMTPYLVRLVAARRFPVLVRKRGASLLSSLWWSGVSTAMAVLAMLASLPFWLIPPLMVVLPPLIWGWLAYRVFAFDSLAEHASTSERETVLIEHRVPLMFMGTVSGYLGAAPGALWASSSFFVLLAPVLIPLAIWLYALVFAFSSLWFTHYALACLERMRHPGRGSESRHVAPEQVVTIDSPPTVPKTLPPSIAP